MSIALSQMKTNRTNGNRRFGVVRRIPLVLLPLWGQPVIADELFATSGRTANVQIVGFDQGQVRYRLADGKTLSMGIDQIQRILIDRGGIFDDFNLAEQYLHDTEPLKAIPRYERTLNLAQDFWGDLINCRLAVAHDRADHIDRSTFYFVRVLRGASTGSGGAARVYPRSIPEKRDGPVARALDLLGDEIAKAKDEESRTLLLILRFEILKKTDAPAARVHARMVAEAPIPAGARTSHVYEIVLLAMKDVMQDADAILSGHALERAIRDCPDASLPGFLVLKGEWGMRSAANREQMIHAAWAYLRVPIHFPDHELAPKALLGATRVLYKLGRNSDATTLLAECAKHPKLSPSLLKEVEELRNADPNPNFP